MNNHILILNGNVSSQFSKRFDLYIPSSWLGSSSVQDLCDGFLWLVFDFGTEKVLFAKIFVNGVEVEKTGTTDGLVIFGDPASSEYYYSVDSISNIACPEISISDLSKVTQLSSQDANKLETLVNGSIKFVYKVPSSILKYENRALKPSKGNMRNLVKLESRFRKTLLFQDIPVTHSHPKDWSPYLSLAVAVLESFSSRGHVEIEEAARSIHGSGRIGFDFDFNNIDPQRLRIRTFTAPSNMPNSSEVLAKLQSAETSHQEILGELALFVTSLSLIPEQSNSIDLLIETANDILICEIKSSSGSNTGSQCRKAIAQLVEYRYFMSDVTSKTIHPVLIIEESGNSELLSSYERIMKSVGITLLGYQRDIEWPFRCHGFFDLLSKLGGNNLVS